MTRSNARELAVHLIYSRSFTGEEPESVLEARLDRAYYDALSAETEVYAQRPSRKQLAYLDQVGVGSWTQPLPNTPSAGISAGFPG